MDTIINATKTRTTSIAAAAGGDGPDHQATQGTETTTTTTTGIIDIAIIVIETGLVTDRAVLKQAAAVVDSTTTRTKAVHLFPQVRNHLLLLQVHPQARWTSISTRLTIQRSMSRSTT